MTELANGADAPESDKEFDALHGTDTAGSVEPGDLGIGNAESSKLAIRYLPSPLRVTSWMLDRIGVDPFWRGRFLRADLVTLTARDKV